MSGLNDKDVNINYIINTIGSEQFNSFIKDLEKSGEISQHVLSQIGRLKQKLDEGIIPKSIGMDINNLVASFHYASIEAIKSAEKMQAEVTASYSAAAQASKAATDKMVADAQRLNEAQIKDNQRVHRKMKRKGFNDLEVSPEELAVKYEDEYQQGLEKYLSPTEGISTYKIDAEKRKRIPEGEGPLGDLREVQRKEFFGISSKQIEDSAAFFQNIDKEQFSYETAQLANEKYKNIITNNNFAIGQGIKMAMEAPIPEDRYINGFAQRKYQEMLKRTNDTIAQGIRMVIEAPIPEDLYISNFTQQKYQEMLKRTNDSIGMGIRMAIEAPIPDDLYIADFAQKKYQDMLSRTNDAIAQGIRMAIEAPIPEDLYDPNFASKKYKDMVERSNDSIAQGVGSIIDAPIPEDLYDQNFASKNYQDMVKRTNDDVAESFGKFMDLPEDAHLKGKRLPSKGSFTERGEGILSSIGDSWRGFVGKIGGATPQSIKKMSSVYKANSAEADKSNKKFADWGKKFGFMGFILSFVIGRIAQTINGFARTIFDFGTGLLSTDKATQAMIDNIVNVAMGGGADTKDWTDKAVKGWNEWYAAAKEGQAELGKFSILLMGPFAAAARGMTKGLTWMITELEKLDIADLSGSIQEAFKIIAESIGGVVVSLVKTVIENKGSLEVLAGFLGEFFKGFFDTIIGVAGLLVKLGPLLKPLGGFLGSVFAGITLLGQGLSILGGFANVLAMFKIPGLVLSIGGVGKAAGLAAPLVGALAAAIDKLALSAGAGALSKTAVEPFVQAGLGSIVGGYISMFTLAITTAIQAFLPMLPALVGGLVIGWAANSREAELQTEAAKRGMQRQYEILKGKPTWGPGIDENGNWSLWTEHKNDVQGRIIEKPLGTPLTDREKIPGAAYGPSNLPNVNPNQGTTDEYGFGEHIPSSYKSNLGPSTSLYNWGEQGSGQGPKMQNISQTMPSAPSTGIATANFYNTFNIQNFYANGLSDATDLSTTLGNSTLEQIRRAGVSF